VLRQTINKSMTKTNAYQAGKHSSIKKTLKENALYLKR